MAYPRIELCEYCGSEGRIYRGHPNDPEPRDDGPCPVCEGKCEVEIWTLPIEMEDLDEIAGDFEEAA
jgi:hypothetical protein